ncbi:MAG: YdcF family protein [Chlorobium sp.]|nr:MAG: YdcF family protein [Chlorobium sp.]
MKFLFKRAYIFLFWVGVTSALIFLSLGVLVSNYADIPIKSDVIIVLGGDNGLRVYKGAELYKAGFANHIILTGIDERFYRPNHPNWRERRMREMGVPKGVIMVDAKSGTSWEEALNTSNTMEKRGWKSAIIVSDPPHLLRLHQTWSRAFKGSSKHFILVPTEPKWWHQILWWRTEKSYQFVINEIKKNLFYAVVHY